MIQNIIEEENFSSQTLPLGFIRRLLLFRVPFVLLITYGLLLRNFIALGYFIFGLLLLNLEIEKHYKVHKHIQAFKGNAFVRLRDLFKFKTYIIPTYYLLLVFSLASYLFKLIMIMLYYVANPLYEDIISKITPENFELYLVKELSTKNILLTLLPNMGVIIMSSFILLFRVYLENIRISTLGKFRGLFISKYVFIAMSALAVSLSAIFNVSLISMVFVTIMVLYFICWGSIRDKQLNFFYAFSKIFQLFSVLALIAQYVLSIETVRRLVDHDPKWNFDFIGVIDLNHLDVKSIFYLVGLFWLLLTTACFADIKKSAEVIKIYKDISGKEVQDLSSLFYESRKSSRASKNSFLFENVLDEKDRIAALSKERKESDEIALIKDKKSEPDAPKEKKKSAFCFDTFIKKMAKVFNWILTTFKKIGFSLRILQIVAIVMAFRCPTVFSLPSIFWLFVTSLTNNIHIIFYLTVLFGLPASVLTFYGIYIAHIPNNQLIPNIPPWLGNIDIDPFWMEYMLTFCLMVLYCNFLRQLKEVYATRTEESSTTLITGNLNLRKLGNVFLAIILKSTYYFALVGLFLIGTNKVTVFNAILVTFFIVFFISEVAAKKRWVLLLLTSIVIIFTRYVWGLGIIHIGAAQAKDSVLKRVVCLLGIVDIEDIHSQDLTGTIKDQNMLTNLLFWIMFLFVLLQYDVYRSSFIRKDGFEMLRETDYMKKHVRSYNEFVRSLKSLYYQGFIWFGYIVIVVTLAIKSFSCFNLAQTFFLFVIFCIHLNKLRSNEATAHKGMYYIWNFFIILTTLVTSARYLYSFTTFDFLDEYVLAWAEKNAVVNFVINQSKLIGFSFNSNLQSRLFGDILILVCSVSMREIFKMHKLFYDAEAEEAASNAAAGLNDPMEISQEKRRHSILESFVNYRKETLRLIYQEYINVSLLKEWTTVAKGLEIFSYFFSLIVFLVVALLASLFRLSFGFFIMLCIYCYYFSKVNSAAIKLFKERNIPQKLKDFTSRFLDWFSSHNKKKEKLVIGMIYDEDNVVFKEFVKMTLSWRFTVWNFIFMLSTTLFLMSYFCRMLSFAFFKTYGPVIPQIRLYAINASFLLGTYSDNDNFFIQTFPYILLIALSVIELKLAHLLREKIDEQLNIASSKAEPADYASIEIKERSGSEVNPQEEEEKENHENLKALRKTGSDTKAYHYGGSNRESLLSKGIQPEDDDDREDYLSEYERGHGQKVSISEKQKQELRTYYQNNYTYLKMKIMEGLLNIVARIVIFMLLYNGAHKENIFGFFYWIGACIAWGATTKYDIRIMVNITNFAIILLLLQYFLLILNLSEFTSPIAPPADIMYSSLLAFAYGSNIIRENQIIKALGYGFQKLDSTRMIGDSMTFLVLQLFVWTFVLRAEYILNRLAKRVGNHLPMISHSDQDKAIRSPRYVYLKWIVKSLIVHSPRIVVIAMSAIALLTVSLSNFILAILFLLNIILVDFVLAQAQIPMKMKFNKILFKVTQFSLLIFLVIYITDHLPLNVCPIFKFSAIYIDKAILFTILQIVVDLINTEDFKRTYEKHVQKDSIRGRLIALCTTYKFNDKKLYKYLDDYILKKELDEKLVLVSQRINKWHAQFFDDAPTVTPKEPVKASMVEEDERASQAAREKASMAEEEENKPVRPLKGKRDKKIQFASEIQSESPDEKQPEELQEEDKKPKKSALKKEEESRSKLTNFKIKLLRKLFKFRNPFIFASISELYKGVVEKNKQLVQKEVEELDYSAFKDLVKIVGTLDNIERFYLRLERVAHQNQISDLNENIAKLEEEDPFIPYSSPSPSRGVSFTGAVVALQEVEPVTEKIGPVKSVWQPRSNVPEDLKIVQNREYANYSIWKVFKVILETWLSYWEYFCYFMLVIYQIDSKGLLMIVVPFAIFGYALTEETRPRFKFWTVLFSFIVIEVLLKFTMQYFFYGTILTKGLVTIYEVIKVLVGPEESFAFEIVLIIIIQIQMAIEIKCGFESGPELVIENVNQAFVRKKINDDFYEIKKKLEKNQADTGIKTPVRDNMRNEISFFDRILNEVEQDFMTGISKFSFKNQTNYFFRLFSYYNKKVGIEVYPAIAIVQLIIAVYILAFYSSMENGNLSQSITSSFRFNEFSGPMVIALFAHIGVVLLDRRVVLINNAKMKKENLEEIESPSDLYVKEKLQEKQAEEDEPRERDEIRHRVKSPPKEDPEEEEEGQEESKITKKVGQMKLVVSKIMARMSNAPPLSEEAYHTYSSFAKLILQIFLLIMLSYFIYWHLPSIQTGYMPFTGTATVVFYLLFAIYFTLSAFQLKYGIPGFKGKLFLMKHYTMWNSIGFKVYRAVPFFFEIKTFMDWTFTHTALDLFQWLKLEDVYGQLFVTKIATDAHFDRKLGQHVDRFSKFTVGFCGITFLLLLILGPLLLFSTYNPLADDNYVVGATVSLGFRIGKNNYFSIFSNSHVSTIDSSVDKTLHNFDAQPALRDVGTDRIRTVTMAPFSEDSWGITYPNYDLFKSSLDDVIKLLKNDSLDLASVNSSNPATLEIEYQFLQLQNQKQNLAPTAKTVAYSLMKPTKEESLAYFQNLSKAANCSQQPILVKNFYDSLIRLGIQQAPSNVSVGSDFLQSVNLQLVCPKFSTSNGTDSQIDNSYWRITTDDKGKKGLVFFAITNKVSSFLTSFSIQAFYVTIVLVIGNVVRNALSGQIQNLTLSDLPAAIELIQICEGILIARADKNLVKEEKLYWELVDILRSPEVLKLITKSAVKEKVRKTKKLKQE